MIKELQDFGLGEKEAKVYAAALELGPATADQLSKHSKILRPTTYVQLQSLMKKGLMSTYEEGKKTFFAPESPELLKRLLSKQKDELNSKEHELANFLPDLLRQFEGAGERPVVRFYPGKEGITTTREEVLKTKDKKSYVIFSYDKLSNIYSKSELENYSMARKALGILSRGIYVNKPHFDKASLDSLTERRFLKSDLLNLSIDISIFDDKTVLRSLEGKLFGVVIQSEQIASNMKMIFNYLWENSQGPDS
ncbi:MAG: helix-turn-helix domain-containing protein [Patescibacteria group bacterium]